MVSSIFVPFFLGTELLLTNQNGTVTWRQEKTISAVPRTLHCMLLQAAGHDDRLENSAPNVLTKKKKQQIEPLPKAFLKEGKK